VVPLAVGLVLVPVLDHAVKLAVRHALAAGAVSLGSLGEVRIGLADLWIRRASPRVTPRAMWIVWIIAAAAVVVLDARLSWSGWFSGLLLGGSLSHALEISMRGAVCDYIRLRFWPAFDLADVAVAVGAGGLLAELVAALCGAHP
jgi:signal peptidase II